MIPWGHYETHQEDGAAENGATFPIRDDHRSLQMSIFTPIQQYQHHHPQCFHIQTCSHIPWKKLPRLPTASIWIYLNDLRFDSEITDEIKFYLQISALPLKSHLVNLCYPCYRKRSMINTEKKSHQIIQNDFHLFMLVFNCRHILIPRHPSVHGCCSPCLRGHSYISVQFIHIFSYSFVKHLL